MSISVYRPQGAPGTYRGQISETPFEVVLDRDGLIWHHHHEGDAWFWVPMPGWDAARFERDVVDEWVEECPHDRFCDTASDCASLRREEERIWGAS